MKTSLMSPKQHISLMIKKSSRKLPNISGKTWQTRWFDCPYFLSHFWHSNALSFELLSIIPIWDVNPSFLGVLFHEWYLNFLHWMLFNKSFEGFIFKGHIFLKTLQSESVSCKHRLVPRDLLPANWNPKQISRGAFEFEYQDTIS